MTIWRLRLPGAHDGVGMVEQSTRWMVLLRKEEHLTWATFG